MKLQENCEKQILKHYSKFRGKIPCCELRLLSIQESSVCVLDTVKTLCQKWGLLTFSPRNNRTKIVLHLLLALMTLITPLFSFLQNFNFTSHKNYCKWYKKLLKKIRSVQDICFCVLWVNSFKNIFLHI